MRISELTGRRVVTEHGLDLGSVVDVEIVSPALAHSPEHAGTRGLVCGTLGLLERVGLRAPGGTMIAWQRVVRIEREAVVVAEDTHSHAERRNGRRR